jgi:hypothetical protein
MSDAYFERFLARFSPQDAQREVPASTFKRYSGRLPAQLLCYWRDFGWGRYGDGLFWIVNPQEYESALHDWLRGTWFEGKDIFHVIAVSAFGEMWIWGEVFGYSINLSSQESQAIALHDFKAPVANLESQVGHFFATRKPQNLDFYDFFKESSDKLGQLCQGQMYGFVPALALGGMREIKNIEKVSAIEYLTLLAELEGLSIVHLPQ